MAPAGAALQRAPRGGNWLQVVGRLAPGATIRSAQEEASGIASRLAETYPARERGLAVRVTSLHEFETRDSRTPVLLLLGAALAVYLVVCVNVGGLLLVRALARDHEAVVRTALGAGRWAMVRLTLLETSLISMLALPGAWLVAWLVIRALGAAVDADSEGVLTVVSGPWTAAVGSGVLSLTALAARGSGLPGMRRRGRHPRVVPRTR